MRPTTFRALGVSAMMHGYLAFDAAGELLVPFRTWRNTSTERGRGRADARCSGHNIPLRWSVAHLYQAILDDEPHVPQIASVTTLAGYVHRRLTGRDVLGVGDASGVFPIDTGHATVRRRSMLAQFDALVADRRPGTRLVDLLPRRARRGAGGRDADGRGRRAARPDRHAAARCAASARRRATPARAWSRRARSPRAPRTSASGTSIFAMVVLEKPLAQVHDELDLVTTPAGDLVAMVHCNNGASELGAWAEVFGQFAAALGQPADAGRRVRRAAARGARRRARRAAACSRTTTCPASRSRAWPRGARSSCARPDSRLTLANFVRAQVYSAFGTLSLGMRVLADEGVELDAMYAHGGLFRTAGVAQRLLAAAVGAPVAVGSAAGEGGAWGIAVLATYLDARRRARPRHATSPSGCSPTRRSTSSSPTPTTCKGFAAFLERYVAGLAGRARRRGRGLRGHERR